MDPQGRKGDSRQTQLFTPWGRGAHWGQATCHKDRSEVTVSFFTAGFRLRDKEVKSKGTKGKRF